MKLMNVHVTGQFILLNHFNRFHHLCKAFICSLACLHICRLSLFTYRCIYLFTYLAHSANLPTGLGLCILLEIISFFFNDRTVTNYLGIYHTDFRNLFTVWKRFGCRWSNWTIFSARCNICISRLCYDVSVRLSVRLSVTEVHWRIVVAGRGSLI